MTENYQVIVVATAGWVFVGTPVETDTKNAMALEDAAVIRRWGTTRGIGELALRGAQKETVIDPAGYLELPTHSIIATIKVADHVRINTL